MKLITLERLKTAIAELIKKIAAAFDSLDARVEKVEGDYLSKSTGGTVSKKVSFDDDIHARDVYIGKWSTDTYGHSAPVEDKDPATGANRGASSLRVNGTTELAGDIITHGQEVDFGNVNVSDRITADNAQFYDMDLYGDLDMGGNNINNCQSITVTGTVRGNTYKAPKLDANGTGGTRVGKITEPYADIYGTNIHGTLDGKAASADKLNTNAGAANKPVYFANGVPAACTYELNRTVPANAVFTDTDTKVTQTATATAGNYPILLGSAGQTATLTQGANFGTGITANPNTGTITAKTFSGKATSAGTADTANAVAWANVSGRPAIPAALKNPNALTFTGAATATYDGSEAKTVNIPANTDTHWTSHLYACASATATAKATAATTNPYLNLIENNAVRDSYRIKGSGAATVTSDTNGNITINSTDTKYTHPTNSGNKHIPSGGSSGQILRWSADGTAVWGADNNTTYGTGNTSTLGLTKLYTGTGTATDGTMTQNAITAALNGKAATNHSHSNYSASNHNHDSTYLKLDGTNQIQDRKKIYFGSTTYGIVCDYTDDCLYIGDISDDFENMGDGNCGYTVITNDTDFYHTVHIFMGLRVGKALQIAGVTTSPLEITGIYAGSASLSSGNALASGSIYMKY